MSVAPGPSTTPPIDWGKVLTPAAERVGGGLGGFIGGKIGQAVGLTPTSYQGGVTQKAIDDQIENIKKLTEEIQARAEYYRGLGEQATADLGKISGISIPQYRTAAIDQFNQGVAAERALGQSTLQSYDPNLLRSAAGGRFRSALSSAADDYRSAIGALSSEGSQRFLTAATAVPVAAFKSIADDRDFNNLLNPEFMSQATNPMTVSMDLTKYKPYMTYNV